MVRSPTASSVVLIISTGICTIELWNRVSSLRIHVLELLWGSMLEVFMRPVLPLAPAQMHNFIVKATRVAVLVKQVLSALRRCLERPFAPFHQAPEHLSTGKALFEIAMFQVPTTVCICQTLLELTCRNTHMYYLDKIST